ncbi:hypothetical protein DACRYDRAFT_119779 [Dacryopinax primogenitus]|uniref:Uncharacterized protein n=1 Tax=Dacryopinax primogenitus (strain DJM 731) TaxID=1858805 RepID=M5FUN7_DACPD|nr:uncharacterized protein DACRYDRAFT_119779 [Dacryopinax primogenitus]EJT96981.1 hypothetical protein DACRYDRAFT_119779 [Dacryopinax primogenitus]
MATLQAPQQVESAPSHCLNSIRGMQHWQIVEHPATTTSNTHHNHIAHDAAAERAKESRRAECAFLQLQG